MGLAHKLPNVAAEEDDDDPTKVGPGSRRALKAWNEVCAMPVLFDADDDLDELEIGNDHAPPKSHTVVMARAAAPVFAFPTPEPFAPAPPPPARRADLKPYVALAIGVVLGTLMPTATFFLLH